MPVEALNCYKPVDTSKKQLDPWIADQLNDAECSERQAAEGPYYPELGITRESLLAYAAECRKLVASHVAAKASLRDALKNTFPHVKPTWAK